MNTSKTITAITFAALTAIAVPLQAEAAGAGWRCADGGEQCRHGRRGGAERLAARLDLSDEQREQVESLYVEMRGRRQALRAEQRARLDEVLTEEQRAQLEQMRESGRGRGHGRRGGRSMDGTEG